MCVCVQCVCVTDILTSALPQVRPGTEVEDEMDEKLQTMAISDVRTGERGGGGGGTGRDQKSPRDKAREMDPEASLFTDFQIITDIRVSFFTASTPRIKMNCNPLPTIGNGLKKQKSLYKVLTPSIKPPYKFLLAYGSS